MKNKKLQCETARKISITGFLKKLGISPVRENQNSAWYLSPIRNENEASFKVSKILNRWYDHGIGKGGNIIDLVTEMNNGCNVQEALSILDRTVPSFSFQQQNTFAVLKPEAEIRIGKILPIRHPALIRYLERRKINPEVVGRYAREVHYSMNDKKYFAIGLENVSGGWELRNPYYKNAAAPKNYSCFATQKEMLSVTEGMFDFFSLLTLYPGLPHKSDFLVLNSVSFIKRIQKVALPYSRVGLYLDNDPAGKKATKQLLADLSNSVDMSALYVGKKDLNQLLTTPIQRQRRSVR
ncbi:toprim domain-containing protein [Maribellus maritimus]|uniref:toprim domain-containing protein n=1 Tax=Maribellus maritimus TaxID=2870838 RepID=UPI001EE9F69F|nr:toprim domain-containing protein [Maribellus maritimus]MCG6191545.1 toprim domain-containing protein [Maribellus maritimus]